MHRNRIICRAHIRTGLFLLVCSPATWAANIPITWTATETQIAITYTPTTPASCTITATDNNNGPSVSDLDAAKFTNASTDTARTVANGFRWPALSNGSRRTVFIGGHDEVKQGLDGKWYSTALQVNSDHTITVACNSGADTGMIQARTANLLLASYYPELPIPTPGSPLGGVPQPTIDWNNRGQQGMVTDPITGVLLRPIGRSLDNIDTGPNPTLFIKAFDLNSAWTSPANAITNQASGTLATTSTPNAPLFLAWGDIYPGCCGTEISDVQVILYGNSASATEIAEVCITEDGGQTCASQPIDVTFASGGAKVQDSIPSSSNHAVNANYPFPSNYFGGWGVWNKSYGEYDLTNQTYTGINASGNTVTMPAMVNAGFNVDRPAGTPFTLTSCASGANITVHVASIPLNIQVLSQESGLNHTNCTYTEYSAGIRVILKNSGTLNISAKYEFQNGFSDQGGSTGQTYYCATAKVSDITKDCDGNIRSPAASGYLCQFTNGVYLLQDDGRVCLQANHFTTVSQGSGFARKLYNVADPFISANSLLREDSGPAHDIYRMTLNNSGDYTEFHPNAAHTVADKFTYTNISTAAPPIATQVMSSGSALGTALSTGLWTTGLNIASTSLGYVMFSIFAGGDASLCAYAATDSSLNLIRSWTVWDTYPIRWGGCHASPQMLGNYAHVQAGNVPFHFSTSTLLGGPFISGITGIGKNGAIQQYTISISFATASNPVVLTSANNDISGFANVGQSTGAYMTCQGGTGSWTILNRSLYGKKIDNNTFSLYADAALLGPISGSGLGALTGSVTCSMALALYNINVSSVGGDGSGNARVTVSLTDAGYAQKFPDGRLAVRDADPINMAGLSQTTQYYAKASCAGCASNQFDVYTNVALTTHASQASITGATQVTYAETCPDPSTITLPGPQYSDSGFGAPGSPRVRCITFRLNMEPCNWWASSGEAVKYPCPSDPGNTSKSSLQNLAVGDALYMLDQGPSNGAELFFILSKTKTSETQIDVTVERWYGDAIGFNAPRSQNYIYNHPYGGQLLPYPAITSAWINFTAGSAWIPEDPAVAGTHHDVSFGSIPGNIILSGNYFSGAFDDLVDVPIANISNASLFAHNSFPVWAGDINHTGGSIGSSLQSYPDNRHVYSQTAAPEFTVKADWMAINPAFGGGQNSVTGVFQTPQAPLKIRGTTYDLGTTTNLVYKLSNPAASGTLNIKLVPTLVHASPHVYFADKSGPGSVLTDADAGKMCQAFVAGECRANSSAGDVFIVLSGYWNTGNTYCVSNQATLSTPCLYPMWTGAGWAVEIGQVPKDLTGSAVRRLTMAFTLPLAHFTFHNWTASPDGKWGFFASNPLQYRPQWTTDTGSRYFLMKLPAWPSDLVDKTDRTTFVPLPLRFSADPGMSIRVAFGYAENGDPANLYCTTRQQTCWTSAAATPSNPFVFAGEAQQRVACDSGCTVSIPAIAGRILFYQVEHTSGRGTVTDPLQAVALR